MEEDRCEYCKQFDNCKGCPQYDKDFCIGSQYGRRSRKVKYRNIRIKYFDTILDSIRYLFDKIEEIPYGYKLILFDGRIFKYYPTTGNLINTQTKHKIQLHPRYFRKYFKFLEKEEK